MSDIGGMGRKLPRKMASFNRDAINQRLYKIVARGKPPGYSRRSRYYSPVIDKPSTHTLGHTPPGVSSGSFSIKTIDFKTSKKSPATVADSILVFFPFSTIHPSNGKENDPCNACTPAWRA